MAETMKAVRYHHTGGPEVLGLEDVPLPAPGPGEVRVRVRAAGVNFADTERRRGLYEVDVPLPRVLGSEAAGVVDAVGPGVDAQLLGRRVVAWTREAYAEACLAPLERTVALPDALDFARAAALPVQGLTAWHLLHTHARVRAGARVLVHSAAGGVGLLLVQLARGAGAHVLAAASTRDKCALAREHGAHASHAYGEGELAAWVRAQTGGEGADLVLDAVGRDTWAASLAALAPFGHLVSYGSASGSPPPVDVEALFARSLSVSAYWLVTPHPPGAHRRALEHLVHEAARGALRVTVGLALPLAQAPEAHRRLEARATVGKVVLTLP